MNLTREYKSIVLIHVAGGRRERPVWVDDTGIWVDWGLAGKYEVTSSPKAKSFGHLKKGGGWFVPRAEMFDLVAELRVKKGKK